MKIKHILNIHQHFPEYPTREDLLYDVVERQKLKDKPLDKILITKGMLKSLYGDNTKLYEKAENHLDEMLNQKLVTEKKAQKTGEKAWLYNSKK